MEPRPRSAKAIVLELLSAAPGGVVSVQGLLRAATTLGVSDNNLRVTLARLKQQRLVRSAGRGRYQLGQLALAVQQQVARWRDRDAQLCTWRGGWVAVHSGGLPRSDRVAARKRVRALRLLGFEQLDDGLSLRPDNLRGGAKAVRRQLHELGLEVEATVFALSCLDSDTEARACALWDGSTLNETYRRMRGALAAAAAGFASQPLADAAALAFVLGGDAIRHIVLDPLLPSPIVDVQARTSFFEAMRSFDERGRALWTALMTPTAEVAHA